MKKTSQMTKVDLYNDSRVLVPICEQCLKGNHNTMLGRSHVDDENKDRSDCKEVGMLDGQEVQCCCGTGGFVYKPKA